jgi:hypothetical protein
MAHKLSEMVLALMAKEPSTAGSEAAAAAAAVEAEAAAVADSCQLPSLLMIRSLLCSEHTCCAVNTHVVQ